MNKVRLYIKELYAEGKTWALYVGVPCTKYSVVLRLRCRNTDLVTKYNLSRWLCGVRLQHRANYE